MNGCDFDLAIGSNTPPYDGTAKIKCPVVGGVQQVIEIHLYSSTAHTTTVCTYKIGP